MISLFAKRIGEKGLIYWLPYYMINKMFTFSARKEVKIKHIILCVVDHYEPFYGGVDRDTAKRRVKSWVEGFPPMARMHCDADGVCPQHTWFYPPHLDHCFIRDLVRLCKMGLGDIEMHLHHNRMHPFPDTSETLREKITRCIQDYSEYGIFCQPDGTKSFSFIHGDWSLDNALGDSICGVNDEIKILKECGCFADFTFPSLGKAQPQMVNEIYYATDDPLKPKSYSWGKKVRVGGVTDGDLMIVQGIIGLRWKSRVHKFIPSIEASNIGVTDVPSRDRIDYLVKNAIRIKGNHEWLFIKLHAHGCKESDFDSLFGNDAHKMFDYLEQKYNDGANFVLHYVTAREMYNIIKAAESGMEGDPNKYRDYIVKAYLYQDNVE